MQFYALPKNCNFAVSMIPLYRTFLALLAIGLFFSSCKSSKELSTGKGKIPADSLLTELNKTHVAYEWFTGKARVNYEDKSISKSFTATIRMRRDSIIWISITTMLGVEAARLLIREDSVFLLDRLNKQYKEAPLSYLEEYVSFPFSISLLQNILTGDELITFSDRVKVKQEKNSYTISSEDSLYRHNLQIDSDNLTILTEYLADIQSNRSISLVFEDYAAEGERVFSYSRKISVKADEPIELSLKFSKAKWDEPVSFPFHKGERYE